MKFIKVTSRFEHKQTTSRRSGSCAFGWQVQLWCSHRSLSPKTANIGISIRKKRISSFHKVVFIQPDTVVVLANFIEFDFSFCFKVFPHYLLRKFIYSIQFCCFLFAFTLLGTVRNVWKRFEKIRCSISMRIEVCICSLNWS